MIQSRPYLASLPACSLYLKPFGATDGTTYMDWSPTPKTVTNVSTSTANSTTQLRFDPCSIYFNGSAALTLATSTSFDLTKTFAISAWVYKTGTDAVQVIASTDSSAATGEWIIDIGAGGFYFQYRDGGGTWNTTPTAISTNAWHHIAVIADGTNVTAYLDGSSTAGAHAISSNPSNAGGVYIGRNAGTAYYSTAYIDELIILKGLAPSIGELYPQTHRFM